jgi:hypothetical protein
VPDSGRILVGVPTNGALDQEPFLSRIVVDVHADETSARRVFGLVDMIRVGTMNLHAFAPVLADTVRLFRFDVYWPPSCPLQVSVIAMPGSFVRVTGQCSSRPARDLSELFR